MANNTVRRPGYISDRPASPHPTMSESGPGCVTQSGSSTDVGA